MAGGVVPDEGEHHMLAIVLGKAAPEDIELRLFVNAREPGLADVAADYTEMSGPDYVRQLLTADDWALEEATVGLNTPAKGSAGTPPYVFSFPSGNPQPVYGYYLVGADSGRLWGAERSPVGPFDATLPGSEITVTPALRLRTEHP